MALSAGALVVVMKTRQKQKLGSYSRPCPGLYVFLVQAYLGTGENLLGFCAGPYRGTPFLEVEPLHKHAADAQERYHRTESYCATCESPVYELG